MRKDGTGGANTKSGLIFEAKTDLGEFLENIPGYSVANNGAWRELLFHGEQVGLLFKRNELYKYLESFGIDYKLILSKQLLPDDSVYVISNNTVFIVEKKSQQGGGSADEKLQTCDFKKKQYQKLFSLLNLEVQYVYFLSDWFRRPEYRDVLNYIISVGCRYYFDYIPLKVFGLPSDDSQ